MANRIHVASEIAPLKRVIVHRPDEGIARVSPKRAEELLFDDIVYLPQMQREHDVFTDVLRHFLGKENVLETKQLLFEALEVDESDKLFMIENIISLEELPRSYEKLLLELDNTTLTETLINGELKQENTLLFDPIPNFIFTRDIAVTINDHVVVTKAAKEARYRENFLTRYIFWAHPLFREVKEQGRLINLNHVDEFPPSRRREMVSLEGGDVMMLNEDYLLIGCSERTTAHAIRSLKKVLFERGVVKNIVQINIPTDRSYMHIDTIFTQIHHHHTVAFKPIVIDGLGSYVEVQSADGEERYYHSIRDFLLAEINSEMEFILSGNGISPYQDREQWTDGCNLVAIKPGVALTYDRNPYTEKAFRQAGYQILHAEKMLRSFKDGSLHPDEVENTIITLPSNELSRARGGSHCMTCPVERG